MLLWCWHVETREFNTILTCLHVLAAIMAPGQADAFGLYPAHYAAMNEDEGGPSSPPCTESAPVTEGSALISRFAAMNEDEGGPSSPPS